MYGVRNSKHSRANSSKPGNRFGYLKNPQSPETEKNTNQKDPNYYAVKQPPRPKPYENMDNKQPSRSNRDILSQRLNNLT